MRAASRIAMASLPLLACHGTGSRGPSEPSALAIAVCDTVVTASESEDGMVGMVAPGPDGAIAWGGGIRATSFHLRVGGRDTMLGRGGDGPGEFRSVGGAWWVGDTVWVSDWRAGRSVGYAIDGEYVGTLTPPFPAAWVRTATGRTVGLAPTSVAIPKVLYLSSPGGERIDTLREFAAPDTFRAGDLSNTSPFTLRRALSAWNPGGGRLCAVTPGTDSDLHLQCVDAAGEGRIDTIVTLATRVVTQQDYDAVVAAMVKGREPALAERLRQSAPKPPFFTAAFGALLDDQDRFWLLRSTVGERSERWEVLSPRGVPVHTLSLDSGVGLVAVRDDVAYLRVERADGFQDALRCEVSPL